MIIKSMNKILSENQIHLAVMDFVRLHPHITPYVIHVPNESPRTKSFGHLLKRFGVRAGFSDLFIAMPKHQYHGAFIEIKTLKGRLTEKQRIFLSDMRRQNYFSVVTYGLDETIKTIKYYCFGAALPQDVMSRSTI